MCILSVRAEASTDFEKCNYIYVGGEIVYQSENISDNIPDGVSYDADTNTLTLNNCSLNYAGTFISVDGDLNICLVGSNKFTNTSTVRGANRGIDSNGRINIYGSGSLTMDFSNCSGSIIGIEAEKILNIETVSLNIKGSKSGSDGYFYGMTLNPWKNYYSEGKQNECYIRLKDATVNISSNVGTKYEQCANAGVDSQDADLEILNSKLNISLSNGNAFGFTTGLYEDENWYGGKLTIDSKSWIIFETRGSTYQYATYFYEDKIASKYIYAGGSEPGTLTTKKKAFLPNSSLEARSECTYTYLELSPHKWDSETITKKATKSSTGKVTLKCTACGKTKNVTLKKVKSVELSAIFYDYDGKKAKPSVTVENSDGNAISSSNYTVSYSNNKNVGKATVTVKLKGYYSGTIKATFTIRPQASSISKVTAKSKGFKVTWKKISSQITGYEIQYSTSSWFTDETTVTKSVKSSKTSLTVGKLKANTKYYVRVRAYKTVNGKKYYSLWTNYETVTTKK